MKIECSSPDRLVISTSPWFGRIFCLVFFIGPGLLAMLVADVHGSITCERTTTGGSCVVRHGTLFADEEERIDLTAVRRARVAEQSDDDGTSCRVELLLRSGRAVPLLGTWSSCGRATASARQLNAFFAPDTAEAAPGNVDVERRMDGVVPMMLVFVTIGVVVFMFAGARRTIVFDQVARTVAWERALPFFAARRIAELHLSQVVGAASTMGSEDSTYGVALLLKDGDPKPLLPYSSSGRKDKDAVTAAINAFLARS